MNFRNSLMVAALSACALFTSAAPAQAQSVDGAFGTYGMYNAMAHDDYVKAIAALSPEKKKMVMDMQMKMMAMDEKMAAMKMDQMKMQHQIMETLMGAMGGSH